MNYEEIIEQYDHDNKYQEIIDLVDTIADDDLTYWHIMEKARAYNNLENNHDGYYLKKALETIQVLEFDLSDDAYWNWIIGYSYFYLNDYSSALFHLRKTTIEWDDDEQIKELIKSCLHNLSLPKFERTFKKRTELFWEAFLEHESQIRLQNELNETYLNEEQELLDTLFRETFPTLNYNINRDSDQITLVLSTDNRFSMLYILLYFKSKAPKEVTDYWNIQIGRNAHDQSFLQTMEDAYPSESIKVWIDHQNDDGFNLSLYQEDLLEDYNTINKALVFNIAVYLVDYNIGELANMVFIDSLEILEKERDEDFIFLSDLKETMISKNYYLDLEAHVVADNRKVSGEPKPKDVYNNIRNDIHFVSTSLPELVDNYDDDEHFNVDFFHDHGIMAGFFYYPLSPFRNLFDEDYGDAILESAASLSDDLEETFGKDFRIMGFEVGNQNAYIQFIAFDFNDEFLNEAKHVFEQSIFEFVGFSPFRTHVEPTIVLAKPLDKYFEQKKVIN